MTELYDVVVVGSGFGGAVTACRLAQAGRSVLILEQGRRWPADHFPRSTGQVAAGFWIKDKTDGFIEYKIFRGMDVMNGVGVGGGSLHYFAVTERAQARIFEQQVWPREIRRQVLDPYYDVVAKMLAVQKVPATERSPLPARTQAFLAASKGAGGDPELLDLAVYFADNGAPRSNPYTGEEQATCNYNSNCLLGCRVRSKNSLDTNYLPLAERHGAVIREHHRVRQIEPLKGGGYRVSGRLIDPGTVSREDFSYAAKTVVVAAGTLGSSELLLRCRDQHGTLPELGEQLGQRFSGNGDFAYAGSLESDRLIDPTQGPAISAGVDVSTAEYAMFIEDVGLPNPLAWLLAGIQAPTKFADMLRLAKDYLLAMFGVAPATSMLERQIKQILAGGSVSHFLPFLGMGSDAADGQLRLTRGEIDLRWNPKLSKPMYDQMQVAMRKMVEQLGGRYVPCMVWPWPLRKTITAHPLGGCFMGDSAADSVVDGRGQVWNYPGLHVIDGSMIPTALAINPSMTIAALAERASFWMIHGRELQAGESVAPKPS